MHLTVTTIGRIDRPGRYSAQCHGLALLVRQSSRGLTMSWTQRVRIDDRPTNVGLGPYPLISTKQAREFALANALAVLKREPLPYGRRRQREAKRVPTLAEAFEKVVEMRRPTWTGPRMEHDWRASFERHVLPSIGNRKVDAVDTAAVIGVLSPIWQTKRALARSIRRRLSAVMQWGRAHGYRDDDPSDNRIDGALPSNGRKTTHRGALDHADVPAAYRAVSDVQGGQRGTALGLMFVMLTGARRDEARLSQWSEIDFDAATWTIPAERVKTRVEHRIPLSDAAVRILHEAQTLGGEYVFTGARGGCVGESGFGWLLRKVGVESTTHGFPRVVPVVGRGSRVSAGARRGRARSRRHEGGEVLSAVRPARQAPRHDGRLVSARHRREGRRGETARLKCGNIIVSKGGQQTP